MERVGEGVLGWNVLGIGMGCRVGGESNGKSMYISIVWYLLLFRFLVYLNSYHIVEVNKVILRFCKVSGLIVRMRSVYYTFVCLGQP